MRIDAEDADGFNHDAHDDHELVTASQPRSAGRLQFYNRGARRTRTCPTSPGERRRRDDTPRVDRSFQRADDMSERDMQDIVAFLESLTDSSFDRRIPARVPSGLPVGGAIQRQAGPR